jgi:hypothetical protein
MILENAKIQTRCDSIENWEFVNPILGKGEIGIAFTNDFSKTRIKVGNGKDKWDDLYFTVDETAIRVIIETLSESLTSALQTETENRINEDGEINISIANEIDRATTKENELENSISGISVNLQSETENREYADTILQENINNLSSGLLTETYNRFIADTALQGNIDNLSGYLEATVETFEAENVLLQEDINTLASGLLTETDDRENAISGLQANINNISGFLETEIENADIELQANIDIVSSGLLLETENRENADTIIHGIINDISGNLTTEITNRENINLLLQGNIDNLFSGLLIETENRENADIILSSNIKDVSGNLKTEVIYRINADANLQHDINNLSSGLSIEAENRENAISGLQNNIDNLNDNLTTETINRENGDIALQNDTDNLSGYLETEINLREVADTILQENINNLSSGLIFETENRENVDTVIQGNINNLSGYLTTEITNRENIDTLLQGNIDNLFSGLIFETENRENADTIIHGIINNLSGNLTTEIENRENADAILQGNIDNISSGLVIEINNRESAISGLNYNINTKITQSNLPSAISDVSINSNSSSVAIKKTVIDTDTGNNTDYTLQIPIATDENVGLMSNADVIQIQTNTTDIEALKNINRFFVVSLSTETPSQEDLTTAFQNVSGEDIPADATVLLDASFNKEYIYSLGVSTWYDRGSGSVAQATNTSPGIVQGSEDSGKIYVETDGTMSLVGYDNISGSIGDLSNNKIDKSSIVDNLTSTNTDKPLSANQGKTLNDDLTTHTGNTSNPHSVTKSQIGLENVDNTADTDKPISTATQTAINNKQDKLSGTGLVKSTEGTITYDTNTYATSANLTAHTGNVSNPHAVTKAQVSLGNVDNTSDADKPVSTATQTAINSKQNSLTTAQLSAVNSGITAALVANIGEPELEAGDEMEAEELSIANPGSTVWYPEED